MTKPPLEFDHIHIIAENPHNTAAWYVEMLGAEITADTVARGAPQIFMEVDVGGPQDYRSIDFSESDHFAISVLR